MLIKIKSQKELVKEVRGQLLTDSDWTQLPDNSLSEEQRNAWATYRQQLRDITNQFENDDDLIEVVWPEAPRF